MRIIFGYLNNLYYICSGINKNLYNEVFRKIS